MVLIRRRRQWRKLAVTALPIRTDGTRAWANMRTVYVVLCAGVFAYLLAWLAEKPRALVVERFFVKLGIFHDQFKVDVSQVRPGPAFDGMLLVAVWICILIDPCAFFLEGGGVNHKRIAFPPPNLIAEKGRVRVRVMLAHVKGDQTVRGVPVKKGDVRLALQQLKRQAAGVVPGYATDDTERLRINCVLHVVFQGSFACRCEG